MVTEGKEAEVEELKDKFERAEGVVLSNYRGISANDMVELRESFTKEGIEYRVVKNTLASIAAEEAGLEGLPELLDGPIAVAVGFDDPVLPFKITKDTAEKYDDFSTKGGVIEGDMVAPDEIEAISKLSSKEELLANLAAGLKSPVRKLAVVLKAKVKDLTVALDQVRKAKEE
ncbi:MAG: 50S ribosomal protein L10 [Candidatus Bipolaricaulota bacterium]|nr:50S ribosomal protein L10 [Candidatus Bipolaricaulota bacterium]MBS3791716.1 50S ribosomal protein L10 [Candidatus Bipolaricaulota bacterium]